jgi:hypothetical protein
MLVIFGAACQQLVARLAEASWQATVLVVIALGPWTALLLVDPRPARAARWYATIATVATLAVAGVVWLAVAGLDDSENSCSPEYEGACIPADVADVDCSELKVRGFRSVGEDPYRLDANGDGIACE